MRNILLTPGITGADGISVASGLVVDALRASLNDQDSPLEVLSLADISHPQTDRFSDTAFRFRGAGGSKLRFSTLALRAFRDSADATIICMHLHLGPVALPLLWHGAHMTILLHGIEAWKPLSRLERLAALQATKVIAVSEHTARRFREFNPEFNNRAIQVCHLGLPDNNHSEECDIAFFPEQSPFALLVGRMAPEERYKGHDILLDMWPGILTELPEACLLFVGDGKDRPRLEAKCTALGLASRVRFTGKVSDTVLRQLYRDCTFFIMPSRHEGFGLVFLEAMQAGKACIGGIGAAGEIIEEGITGMTVDPDQSEQVQQAILRLFREPGTRERMGRAGAKRQAEEFSEEQFRRRFCALLGSDKRTAVCVE